MRKIWISDITMKRSGENGDHKLSFREKIELAKLLDKLGVSVIETDPIENKKIDSLLIKSIASAVKNSYVAVPVDILDGSSVDTTWAALKEAAYPRLQVVSPVSTVQMEYFCHKKPAAMLSLIKERVAQCKALCGEVEFVAEDAGRSELDFLYEAIAAAVDAGAGIVTVCDTAGNMMPEEFGTFVAEINAELPENVRLGVRCSNELYMADSCAVAAVKNGADEIKTAASGESTASLDKVSRIIKARGSSFDAFCEVRNTELQRTVGQIKWMCQTNRSKTSAFDNGVQEDKDHISLTVHDDMSAVAKAVEKLGYDLSEDDIAKVYEAFTRIAARKETMGGRELDAIVASAALQVPPTYRIESYVFTSGNVISATSHIKLRKGEELLEGVCLGDGPVDSSFLAIEQIIGRHYELDDFQIQAVTEGREAMGEAIVRLRSGGKVYSGRGISTDVIGASIRAYVNALNKIVYEEA